MQTKVQYLVIECIVISSMAQASSGGNKGNKHWALMVDEATRYKKIFFLKRKMTRLKS